MKRIATISALASTLLVTGCFSTTYVSKSVISSPSAAKVEQKMNFFWWGLSGTGNLDASAICGGRGAARINTQHTFVNALLGFITLGIYVPRTAFVTCGQ